MKRFFPLPLVLLAGALAGSGAARAGVHLGAELATTSKGEPVVALVGGMEFTSRADYRWFHGYELSITAISGKMEQDERGDWSDRPSGDDYRRDAFRYGWGWEDTGRVTQRFRIGTVLSLEHHSIGTHEHTSFQGGAFASVGLEWQRRYRAELLADTTQHFSLLFAVGF